MANPKPPCLGPCHYFGFDGLKRACFEPQTGRHLELAPARCPRFVADDQKGGGHPKKLTLEQFRDFIEKEPT